MKSIENESGISLLGDITHEVTHESNMMAYTINIPPDHWMVKHGTWGELIPEKQIEILKKVHSDLFIKLKDKLEDDNEVAFEFTKKGEIHSHGYFRYKEKYVGYKIHVISLKKQINNIINISSYYSAFTRWVDQEDKWKEYIRKEINITNISLYKATPGVTYKTILNYYPEIKIKDKEADA